MEPLKADLLRYLRQSRDALVHALDGLGEYDVRRPLVPSGTNLLGLVTHVVGGEVHYLGACVGRPAPLRLAWYEDGSVWDGADMWATAAESHAERLALYRAAWVHSDATVAELSLDAPAEVPWWPAERRATTLGHLPVRVVTETAQHAGHAEVLRESLDGRGGGDRDEIGDGAWWAAYVEQISAAAEVYR